MPDKVRLRQHFICIAVLTRAETHLVHIDNYELSFQVICDFNIRFALAFKSIIVAACEDDGE